MARLSVSNFLRPISERRIALLLLVALLAAGCSTPREGMRPVHERWPAEGAEAAAPYLLALREYLALPAGKQAAHREKLRRTAERLGGTVELEYAFALSVDRDDRASLESAVAYFETLLASPDPLPVSLDALVRLQLGQSIDRLQRMQASGDIHHAYRAASTERKVCQVNLDAATNERDALRTQLDSVQRKLEALARIELEDGKSRRESQEDN